jgi:hypothetical protein
VTDPARALAGRREIELLEFPSVCRMADLLGVRCREPSWVRTLVAGLERFRTMTGNDDLERLLEHSRGDVAIADRTLHRFGAALHGHPDTAVAALAMGPKVWFRVNDVPVSWRPLPAVRSAPPVPAARTRPDRLALLALIGSGLAMSELLRLRLGDVGSLDRWARLIPDPEAEPLAVQHTPRRGSGVERITFLTYPARLAFLEELAIRRGAGLPAGPDASFIVRDDGRPATRNTVGRARRRTHALIEASNDVNVALCMATGDFFRAWGPPGARFRSRVEPEEVREEGDGG